MKNQIPCFIKMSLLLLFAGCSYTVANSAFATRTDFNKLFVNTAKTSENDPTSLVMLPFVV